MTVFILRLFYGYFSTQYSHFYAGALLSDVETDETAREIMSMAQPQKVLIVGASITGLTAALALKAREFDVTILEADGPPDDSIGFENSSDWRRRGVPHAGQPHFFLGKLRKIMREWYPALMSDLRAAGIPEMDFETYLHPIARKGFKPEFGDDDLSIIAARRSTMELAMRKHIVDHAIADIVTSTTVTGLILDGKTAPFTVCGVRTGSMLISVRSGPTL